MKVIAQSKLLKVKERAKERGDVWLRYRRVATPHKSPLEHPRKDVAPPWSAQRPSALYGMILHRSGPVNHPQLVTPYPQAPLDDHQASNHHQAI